jgi:hypothetical protein
MKGTYLEDDVDNEGECEGEVERVESSRAESGRDRTVDCRPVRKDVRGIASEGSVVELSAVIAFPDDVALVYGGDSSVPMERSRTG